MRWMLVVVAVLSFETSANTGGFAGGRLPQPIQSVKRVELSQLQEIPLPRGFFTKYERFQFEQEAAADLREQLKRQYPGALKVEQYISVAAYGGRSDSIRSDSVALHGHLTAFALATTEQEGWERVDGWQIVIHAKGWFNPVYQSDEVLPADAVLLAEDGLVLKKPFIPAIRESFARKGEFWKEKVPLKGLTVALLPKHREAYSVLGVKTGGMFNWKDSTDFWIRLDEEQSREFLWHLHNCELLLSLGPS